MGTAFPATGLADAHLHLQRDGGLGLHQCNLNYQPLTWDRTAGHITGCGTNDGGANRSWLEAINMDYACLITKTGNVDKVKLDTISKTPPILFRSTDGLTDLSTLKRLRPPISLPRRLTPMGA